MIQDTVFQPLSGPQSRSCAALDVVAVAGAVALGAFVRVPLPFSPVPLTMQTFVVLLAGFAVGRSRATAGILLYLGLGLAHVPIFAAPFGPTFGYLLAFAAVPFAATHFRNPAAGLLAASAFILVAGATWLGFWMHWTAWQAIVAGVVPFIAGDILKALAAYSLVGRVRR